MLDRAPAPDAAPIQSDEAAAIFARAFGDAGHVLLAVSGGADSTALLILAAEWRDAPRLSVATVNHGLRAEAVTEAADVAELAGRLGLSHAILAAPVSSKTRIEAAAREVRYSALREHADRIGADAIATAHTLDDQAETVLMRLAAGSGPAGLAAMRPETTRDGLRHFRPLLDVPKTRLVASLAARGIGWSEDAMNADSRFARPRLRTARDALAAEGLTARRLGRFATRMARADAAIAHAVDQAADAHVAMDARDQLVVSAFAGLPEEILLRLLARLIAQAGGGELRLERLERLIGRILGEPKGAATLAGAKIGWRRDAIVVSAAPPRRDGAATVPGV
ncbi:tRNA lysidine(34) synthetase TilS [Hansschlegelia quercus]|uniref:tRNA(Ile)-lysidine synthase n=1 Tax=Hansschlegelia quercus TaxID=2528245 RepID=A0A4Q9GL50_9HYPH|nr:tRNA lysidine(34) synthetase TilS [Hansschlegelia quercus]TBN54958.1 tRNA lysidine(34) synthetase TilS [Hansschlegelia quercus]